MYLFKPAMPLNLQQIIKEDIQRLNENLKAYNPLETAEATQDHHHQMATAIIERIRGLNNEGVSINLLAELKEVIEPYHHLSSSTLQVKEMMTVRESKEHFHAASGLWY